MENLLTNILVSITTFLSTNVVTGDNAQGSRDWPACQTYALSFNQATRQNCSPYIPPTIKWTITNVVETKRYIFTNENVTLAGDIQRVVFSTTNVFQAQPNWQQVSNITVPIIQMPGFQGIITPN